MHSACEPHILADGLSCDTFGTHCFVDGLLLPAQQVMRTANLPRGHDRPIIELTCSPILSQMRKVGLAGGISGRGVVQAESAQLQ